MQKIGRAALAISSVRLDGGALVDIAVSDGRIAEIGPAGSLAGETTIEGHGDLVLPSLANGHIHLDKTLLGLAWISHVPGNSVQERVAAEKTIRRKYGEGMAARATALVKNLVGLGTGTLRCHVDVDEDVGIENLETLLAIRDKFRDHIDIQFVAFPQSGLFGKAEIISHMTTALQMGADIVGGLDPAGFDNNVDGQLDIVFGLAGRFSKPIDIHLHDRGERGAEQLCAIAERTIAAGMQGKVTVSHAFALGEIGGAVFLSTSDLLAKAGVSIMTNGPGNVPMPPVATLKARGVRVFAGTDNIRDAWSPYGDGDMMGQLRHIGYMSGLNADPELRHVFDLGTTDARTAMDVTQVGLTVGSPADLILVKASHIPEAVVTNPGRRIVLKSGRVVAREGVFYE